MWEQILVLYMLYKIDRVDRRHELEKLLIGRSTAFKVTFLEKEATKLEFILRNNTCELFMHFNLILLTIVPTFPNNNLVGIFQLRQRKQDIKG